MTSLLIFGAFFNIVEDVVNRFFGVVAGYGALDIGEEFSIMLDCLEDVRTAQSAQ